MYIMGCHFSWRWNALQVYRCSGAKLAKLHVLLCRTNVVRRRAPGIPPSYKSIGKRHIVTEFLH